MNARLRAWWRRVRLAWRLARTPELAWLAELGALLRSPVYEGAAWAVQKTGLDVSLKAAKNEQLRAEAVEWAGHWYREHGVTVHPWQVRVCVELAVGKLRGYL